MRLRRHCSLLTATAETPLRSDSEPSVTLLLAGDADSLEKQKKQASNPHIELRECVVDPFSFSPFHTCTLSAVHHQHFFCFVFFSPPVEFSDASAKFYCRMYYAAEFHRMREEIMESSEEEFVRSLSHCVNWQARGGKSGAVFYATEGWVTPLTAEMLLVGFVAKSVGRCQTVALNCAK